MKVVKTGINCKIIGLNPIKQFNNTQYWLTSNNFKTNNNTFNLVYQGTKKECLNYLDSIKITDNSQ